MEAATTANLEALLEPLPPAGDVRLAGPEKAATLLCTIGPERAAMVFSCLNEHEIETLSLEMTQIGVVDRQTTDSILVEVAEMAYAARWAGEGGFDYARSVLEKAVGSERAGEVMAQLTAIVEQRPFDFLHRTSPQQIVSVLKREARQTVALVIANLDRDLGAKVVGALEPEVQADVAFRIATMGDASPEVVRAIEELIRRKLDSVASAETRLPGGVDTLVALLGRADRGTERNVLERLAAVDRELAEDVRLKLFVFEDLARLDDRSMQVVLREIDQKDLVAGLRTAPLEVRDKITSNLSQRAAEMLLEELDLQLPIKRRTVEEAQARIVGAARDLDLAGAIVIPRADEAEDELI
jgi:flagellar motor switch protein FliG